jgi:hypothetical protein
MRRPWFILINFMRSLLASCTPVLQRIQTLDWQAFFLALRPALRSVTITLLILGLVSTTGCSGCQSKEDQEKAKQAKKKKEEEEKKKRLPDFESMSPIAMPGIVNDPVKFKRKKSKLRDDPIQKEIDALRSESLRKNFIKPGHWHDIRFQALANHYDIEGELYAGAVPVSNSLTRFVPVEGTNYAPVTNRLAALPKGAWKTFDTSVFYPTREQLYSSASIRVGFNRYGGSRTNFFEIGGLKAMTPDQHHLLVLTNRKDVYRYLDLAPTVQLPGKRPASYVVIASDPAFPAPVPRHALNWTTIAYLIWDDFDPDLLDSDQQTAMVDWVHFGGQLILSGPDCVERLENSFLGDYLPARADAAVNLSSEDLLELNSSWSLPEKNASEKTRDLQILDKSPVLGVNFQLHSDADFMPGSGDLVVERQLGRGRIVATSFSLAAPAVRSWRSLDSFLNNVLLRRSPRTFFRRDDFDNTVAFRWKNDSAPMREPLLHSSLRFLSRDLSSAGTSAESRGDFDVSSIENKLDEDVADEFDRDNFSDFRVNLDGVRDLDDRWHYGGYDINPKSGVASWNDFAGVSAAARSTLQDAAGISPPSGNFVLQLLAGYLFVLVPVNWLVFWLIGKVEYAWIAAPIIAIVGAVVVIRMASLDIGFTRSNTQVALLEVPADYDRGHLTEYSALYTSLSTNYRVELDNASSQALPFPAKSTVAQVTDKSQVPISVNKFSANELSGLQIQSNSTELIHAEHLLSIGGKVFLNVDDTGKAALVNDSTVTLKNVLVVGGVKKAAAADSISVDVDQKKKANKSPDQLPRIGYKFALVEEIAPKSQMAIQFDGSPDLLEEYRSDRMMFNSRRDAAMLWKNSIGSNKVSTTLEELSEVPEIAENWDEYSNAIMMRMPTNAVDSIVTKEAFLNAYEQMNPAPYVSLGKMFDCVFENLQMGHGDYRLFATTDEKLGKTKIYPDSTQSDRQTLIVAHLTHPQLPQVARDTNSVADLKRVSDLDHKKMELFE